MSGMYKPSSPARSPESTSVANGSPNGSNDPVITLSWGRLGSSLLCPNCNSPPVCHVMITRNGGRVTADHLRGPVIDFQAPRSQVLFDLVPRPGTAQVSQQMAQPIITGNPAGR